MLGGMGSAATPDLSKGGTIDGDITITGDFKVEGGGSFSFDEIVEGTQVIEKTGTEAFLVRKDSDGGDVFIVDTTNTHVGIATAPSYPLHVQGAYEVLAQFAGGNAQLNIDQSTSARILLDVPSSGDYLGLGTEGVQRMRIDANSRISLGNNDSGGDTTNTIFGYTSGDSIARGGI